MGICYKQSFQGNFSARSLGRHGLRTLFTSKVEDYICPHIDNLKRLKVRTLLLLCRHCSIQIATSAIILPQLTLAL